MAFFSFFFSFPLPRFSRWCDRVSNDGDDSGERDPLAWVSPVAIGPGLLFAVIFIFFSLPMPSAISLGLFFSFSNFRCACTHSGPHSLFLYSPVLLAASMSAIHPMLAPTSSLPPLRTANPDTLTEAALTAVLHNLNDIYCPLPRAAAFSKPSLPSNKADYLTATPVLTSGVSTPLPVDSGYASGEEDDDAVTLEQDRRATICADEYERQFTIRWLTSFIARAEELLGETIDDEEARQRLIDDASYILASFSSASNAEEDDDAGAIVREFRFQVQQQKEEDTPQTIEVRLTDGTPAIGNDHTDVGLQSWGASIVVSDLLCADPARFDMTLAQLGQMPSIIELGAGTGLVGITLAKLLPVLGVTGAELLATDYHPAVLANLRDNIAANFPGSDDHPPLQTSLLDWSAPSFDIAPADVLIATDVVYAAEHAVWLRDCAGKLLKSGGVFWLVASVRPNGRFEGVTDTVEAAFTEDEVCPQMKTEAGETKALRILAVERLEKRKGVGRADEIGYKVFRIGWDGVDEKEVV